MDGVFHDQNLYTHERSCMRNLVNIMVPVLEVHNGPYSSNGEINTVMLLMCFTHNRFPKALCLVHFYSSFISMILLMSP